jgi:hypothetical protein
LVGEKEENDRIPSRKLKSSLKSPVPYHKQNGGPPRSISGLNDPPEIVITIFIRWIIIRL